MSANVEMSAQTKTELSALVPDLRKIGEDRISTLAAVGAKLAALKKRQKISVAKFLEVFSDNHVRDLASKALAAHRVYAWMSSQGLDKVVAGKISGTVVSILSKRFESQPAREVLAAILEPYKVQDVKERTAAIDAMLRTVGCTHEADKINAAREKAREQRRVGTMLADFVKGDAEEFEMWLASQTPEILAAFRDVAASAFSSTAETEEQQNAAA